MSNTKRQDNLSHLLKRYQHLSVVNEIEKNLSNVRKIDYAISSLYPSDLYDTKNYDLACYPSLEESIRKDGLLLPLIIIKGKGKERFEIINGVKRFLIAKKAKMKEVPCILADISQERKLAYLVENIVNEEDCPLCKTTCFLTLKEKYGYSIETIASLSHLSNGQVRNLIRLSSLPSFAKDALVSYRITYGQARCLLDLPIDIQKELYQKILEEKISVREIESLKRSYKGKPKKGVVSIEGNKITIVFKSEEDALKNLDRIKTLYSDQD